ncbi:MAG: AraC family transcriptional regulator [Eubacteriales bacterium]|nr:AraC family transcriptional regulator [Eubacteriales bacterium]
MSSLRYHEDILRGSPDFPLDYHYVDERHERYQMPFHWHGEAEILHVVKGVFNLSAGDGAYTLTAGDTAFLPSGQVHGGVPVDCVYECVVFDLRLLLGGSDLCKRAIGELMEGKVSVTPLLSQNDPVTRHTIPPMFDALRQKCDGYELITLGCLIQFIGEVYKFGAFSRHATPAGLETRRLLKLKQVFEMIESRYAAPPTLAELAEAAGMSPKYFCRFFREATHRTPVEYLTYYRIEKACYALASSDQSITEMTLDLGFSDPNYFIRCFRKQKGVTPGQYRKRLRS